MKVAFFAFDIFSPSATAGFVHTIEMAKNLKSLVDLKLFVAPSIKRALNPFLWNERVEGLELDYARFTLWFKPYLIPFVPFNFLSYYSVYNKTKEFHPDIIHERFHSPNPFGYHISEKIGAPRILEVNSPYIEDEAYKSKTLIKIAEKDRKRQFEHADAIITQTETLKKVISNVTDVPVYVVPNGVNTTKFRPIDSHSLRKRLGIPENAIVIAFSGSFRKWHGVHLIPKMARILMEKYSDVYFLMIGSGYLYENIRNSGMKNTIFLGSVNYNSLPAYLSMSDICVAPFDASEFEYFDKLGFWWNPLKLFEYLSMGKPVISFDFDEVKKIIGNGGLLARAGDLDDFIKKLEYLINNKNERQKLGDNARILAFREYDWKKRAQETVNIYQKVL
ncbi:MAG: glycosyltransferase family 4 protein [Candidatus Methanoperedens sp.]|nr:glycosyltransferase family 4 protein [Candidatus Methanoperedens sp.]MCZ7369039.1 glycosyltransferase family 4 protein [Candidatus Methanoperedens sp.]